MPLLMLKDLPRYECLLEAARSFPELDPSACEAFLNLLRAGDEAYRQSEAFFSEHNISTGRFKVLMLLSDKIGGGSLPQTPAEIAEKAGVTRATITGLVDTLERDGLVTREHDSDDRRMMRVHITHKGHAALKEILPGHFRRMAALMAPLSEHERKTLVRLLDKVAGQASALAADPLSHAPVAAE
ncbi:MAG TPA: MarR family transcriptional regulator [Opitutaceae bacterium]|nr:MarR family transcriptional regulator [Opitutaceae bacterium]